VYAQNDLGNAASVTQLRLRGTPFPKIYMIAQLNLFVEFQEYAEDTFVSFLVSTVAERRALLSLNLHFVAQYKLFVIIIIIIQH